MDVSYWSQVFFLSLRRQGNHQTVCGVRLPMGDLLFLTAPVDIGRLRKKTGVRQPDLFPAF